MFGKKLMLTGALTTVTALVGAAASKDVESRWYLKLEKPDFQPPREAFPVVWPVLYGTIAVASAAVLTRRARERAELAEVKHAESKQPEAKRVESADAPGAEGGHGSKAARPKRKTRGYLGALLANLALNAGWSWVFFRQHDLDAALGTAAGLAVSSTDLARRSGKVHWGLGLLLAPYAAWCWFATLLTGSIRSLNR